jgi:serine/tyrosine/threonine adenylyltransferase
MSPFNFNNTYLSLPQSFYSLVKPNQLSNAELVLFNTNLANDLNIDANNKAAIEEVLFGKNETVNQHSFAQAYAGHQFGGFNMLGDGRAIVLGEHLDLNNNRFDIQLKGGGRTPYSRGGDGMATLKAMLREYLISEAMYYLNIPTSRSLAVVLTGENVYRQTIQQGAMVARVMKSHIRIGTFEFASYFTNKEHLEALLNYTINRLYPQLAAKENKALALLNEVIRQQIQLITQWMRVGFIHGVMNTDNVAISGETFDYGPCAFMNNYNPATVFSSIDTEGRYAFGNQPNIIKWNLIKLAQALLPLIHEDSKEAVAMVQEAFKHYDSLWFDAYYDMMLDKIGITNKTLKDRYLVDELLQIMKEEKLDYTNTYSCLSYDFQSLKAISKNSSFEIWKAKWMTTIENNGNDLTTAKQIMQQNNPVFIPRNHKVEEALDNACDGDFTAYNLLLQVMSNPYTHQPNAEEFLNAPSEIFENSYQTFCGT